MNTHGKSDDRLHSVRSAAEFLGGVSESTLRVWLWQGRLTKVKVGRLVRIRESELLELIVPTFPGAKKEVTPLTSRQRETAIMSDSIDELVAHSKDCVELQKFHKFHNEHPEVLDFLVQEIQLRIDHGFEAFSYHSLCEYARWKLEMEKGPGFTFKLNDHTAPFYARAITILHPEFNGRAEFRKSEADSIFGTELEPAPKKRPKNYARRLQWVGGEPIERGWRPSNPHTVNHTPIRKPYIHGEGTVSL